MTCPVQHGALYWVELGPHRAGLVSPEPLGTGSGLWSASRHSAGPYQASPHPLCFQFPACKSRTFCGSETGILGSASSCMAKPGPCLPLPCLEAAPSQGHPNAASSHLIPQPSARHCARSLSCCDPHPCPLQALPNVHQPLQFPQQSPSSPTHKCHAPTTRPPHTGSQPPHTRLPAPASPLHALCLLPWLGLAPTGQHCPPKASTGHSLSIPGTRPRGVWRGLQGSAPLETSNCLYHPLT